MARQPTLPNSRRLRWGILLFAMTLLFCNVGLRLWKRQQQKRLPQQALEWFRAKGIPTTTEELARRYQVLSPEENAAPIFINVAKAVTTESNAFRTLPILSERAIPPMGQPWPKSLTWDCLKVLSRIQDPIASLTQTDSKKGAEYPLDFSKGYAMLLPHLSKLKQLAKVLSLRAQADIEVPATASATDQLEHIFRVGQSLESEPLLISQLVRLAILEIQHSAVERVMNRQTLEDAQLRRLITRALQADTNMLLIALDGEVSVGNVTMKLGLGNFLNLVADADGGPTHRGGADMMQSRVGSWYYAISGRQDGDRAAFLAEHQKLREALALPSHEAFARLNELSADFMARRQARRGHMIFSGMLLPSAYRAHVRFFKASANLRVEATALAVERYRLANNGAFPQGLGELVPQFLSSEPKDPFDGQPLRFRRTRDGYCVYSVGPDLSDDLGTPPPEKNENGVAYDLPFRVERK